MVSAADAVVEAAMMGLSIPPGHRAHSVSERLAGFDPSGGGTEVRHNRGALRPPQAQAAVSRSRPATATARSSRKPASTRGAGLADCVELKQGPTFSIPAPGARRECCSPTRPTAPGSAKKRRFAEFLPEAGRYAEEILTYWAVFFSGDRTSSGRTPRSGRFFADPWCRRAGLGEQHSPLRCRGAGNRERRPAFEVSTQSASPPPRGLEVGRAFLSSSPIAAGRRSGDAAWACGGRAPALRTSFHRLRSNPARRSTECARVSCGIERRHHRRLDDERRAAAHGSRRGSPEFQPVRTMPAARFSFSGASPASLR